MLIFDLSNSAVARDELLRGHVPLGVIGLPTDDFKVRSRLSFDVINSRQHGETLLVVSALSLGLFDFVDAQQRWTQLGTVGRIKAVAAMKCLVDGIYRLFDDVLATTPLVAPGDRHSLLTDQFAVALIAKPYPGRSLQAISIPVIHWHLGSNGNHQTKASSHTNATSDAPAIAIGAHWSRRTRVITTKQLTQ